MIAYDFTQLFDAGLRAIVTSMECHYYDVQMSRYADVQMI